MKMDREELLDVATEVVTLALRSLAIVGAIFFLVTVSASVMKVSKSLDRIAAVMEKTE